MESLFFCLIKRTKNQGDVIVVEARISVLIYDFASKRFILFTPEITDFVGDLLRSFLQKSSVSVHEQNPTIPRPERDYKLGFRVYE
jgi:hypothetical protein